MALIRAVDRAVKHDTPEKKTARQALRRARATHPGAQMMTYEQVGNTHGFSCCICGTDIDMGLKYPHPLSRSFEHVVPLSKKGEHTLTNVKLAHLSRNVERGNR